MKSTSMTAHVIQRASGVLLLVYLFLHVHTIHELAGGPAAFNRALETFRHPVFKLLEIALLGTVILHALNGVRITLLDLGLAQGRERRLFWVLAVGLGALIFLAGAIPLFLHIWRVAQAVKPAEPRFFSAFQGETLADGAKAPRGRPFDLPTGRVGARVSAVGDCPLGQTIARACRVDARRSRREA